MSCHLLCSGTLPASYSCVCVVSLGTRLSTVRHMNISSVQSLNSVRLFATPWTAAHQAPPSTGFTRQGYWSGVPLPSPELFEWFLIYSCA